MLSWCWGSCASGALFFVPSFPSLALIRLTWAGNWWEHLNQLWPITNQQFKKLAMASLHGQIMLHPSVCASTRAFPPAFVCFVFLGGGNFCMYF